MPIDWDEELKEYLLPQYIKGHKKIGEENYIITSLEGNDIEFECSIEGYSCKCHNKTY